MTFTINFYDKISVTAPDGVNGRLDRIEAQLTQLDNMAKNLIGTLDDVLAQVKAQTDIIKGIDTLVETLAGKLEAAIKGSQDLEDASAKVADIMAVVQENAGALAAVVNVNTEDETPDDVKTLEEFESLPPQALDQPEEK